MSFFRTLTLFGSSMLLALSASAMPELPLQKAWRPAEKDDEKQTSVAAVPVIQSEKMVICGNKSLTVLPNGTLLLSNAASNIATITPFATYTVKKNKKTDWLAGTPEKCRVRREGNKIIWEFFKTSSGKTFKAGGQTLEILKDGLIRLSANYEYIDNEFVVSRGNGAFHILVDIYANDGRKIVFNDKTQLKVSSATRHMAGRKTGKYKYELYPGSSVDTFTLLAEKPEVGRMSLYPVGKALRFNVPFNSKRSGSICIDLRKSGIEKIDNANTRAGVNFKIIEDLEMPYLNKNLIFNSSFEQNMIGWKAHYSLIGRFDFQDEKWNSNPFSIVEGGYNGRYALLIKSRFSTSVADYRHIIKGSSIDTPTIFMNPGKYTLSFYAKQISGDTPCYINAWNHTFNHGGHTMFLPPHESGRFTAKLTREWKRYTHTFTIPKAGPTPFSINVNGKAEVLLDAIQVEKGTRATAYEPPAAEGLLITGAQDNFIDAKNKVNARLRIFTSPSAAGKVDIRVKNFFGEVVYSGSKSFKADKNGYSTLSLPLENCGKGIFTVRFDYTLADGRKSYNHTRYAVVDYLNNTHRLKNLFSDDYVTLERHHLFLKILDRYRKVGYGAKSHMFNWDKNIWDTYRKYGVEPMSSVLLSTLTMPGSTKVVHAGIRLKKTPDSTINDKNLIIRDHNLDNNGVFDEAYMERFKKAAAEAARRNKHINIWVMQGEVRAKYPNEWWSKEGTDAAASRVHALYLKAAVEGIRSGNPDAKIYQDDPCNMRPEGGIAETAALLDNCNKHGIRFDLLAIHPYRFSPESPDLDADTQLFFKTIKSKGYGDDVKILWPEMMHWGPFNIPQWGTISSTWGGVPRTWPGWVVSYDIGATEKLSAAWRARSWLVALKYSDRILTATSGGTSSNFHMDEHLTPYCSSLMPNVLGHVLGDSRFQKDIRFAPFCRAYVFTDAQDRPVAAIWCHLDKMDNGYIDSPIAEADFGDSLESVIDLMNNKRPFTAGKFRFPVTGFPVFLRGKPGTLDKMIEAVTKAEIISGEGISTIEVSCNPADESTCKLSLKNLLSREFTGTFNGKKINIPASGTYDLMIPFAQKLSAERITSIPVPAKIKTPTGQNFDYDLSFDGFIARRVPADATFSTVDWDKIPAVPFTRNVNKKETTGKFNIGWNDSGIFIQVRVNDKKFVHTEYKRYQARWRNDCLQIYFDTMANGRFRLFKGYDEDDYDYAVFPNSRGDRSIVWRARSVEQQLGLATQAPRDQTVAHDIPSSFSSKNGVLTYRVFFPAKYLLPIKLTPGWVFGLGLYAANADVPGKVSSALTTSVENSSCFNAPHTYPAVLLTD